MVLRHRLDAERAGNGPHAEPFNAIGIGERHGVLEHHLPESVGRGRGFVVFRLLGSVNDR